MARTKAKGTDLLVERRSLADKAADILRRGILDGDFLPGSRLGETWLSEQMQLSRGTIRAALRELAHEGLVRAIPYTGWAVAELTERDAWELCSVRAALEGLAARLAAQSTSAGKAERLKTAYSKLIDAANHGNRSQCVDADLNLHRTIFELTENRRLCELFEHIEQQIRMLVAFSDLRSELSEIVSWHEALVSAIAAGDAAGAERIARNNADKNASEILAQLRRNAAAGGRGKNSGTRGGQQRIGRERGHP